MSFMLKHQAQSKPQMSSLPLIQLLLEQAHRQKIAPPNIIARAQACGIEPLIWHAVEHGHIDAKRYGFTPKMLGDFKLQQTARLAIWRKSAQIALNAMPCPCILLKGEPLGNRLMGNAIWRITHDIDLWLPQDQIETAESNLIQLGWHRTQEPHLWATNQILLEHEVLAPIELHWALAPRPWSTPTFKTAMANAISTQILNTPTFLLSDSDQWLHLLVHAHQHYFAIKTVCDLLEAQTSLQIQTEHLKPYHLCRLHRFAVAINNAVHTENAYSFSSQITKFWFQNLLAHSKRGELVFGADSHVMAAAGVLIRALSMALLDGWKTPILAALAVIFAGPHPIGKRCHHIYDTNLKNITELSAFFQKNSQVSGI